MKKSVVFSTAFLVSIFLFTGQVYARVPNRERKSERKSLRKLENREVDPLARDHFIVDFGNIPDVKWSRSVNFNEASFIKNGKSYRAFYDVDADLVGTTSVRPYSSLPESARKEIQKKYKDYKVNRVIYYDDNEANDTDMILYDEQFADADSYFVELSKANDKIVLHVLDNGDVFFFKRL